MADADQTLRKQVQQEAAQELLHRQGHATFFVLMCGVSPTKRDLAIGKGDQPVVGYGDPVCIAAQVAKRVFRAAERTFRVDYPILAE